jgi:hypothetical protein
MDILSRVSDANRRTMLEGLRINRRCAFTLSGNEGVNDFVVSRLVGRQPYNSAPEPNFEDRVGLKAMTENNASSGGLYRMTTLIQFVVLKREDKWMVKSTDLERVFPDQRKAIEAAIKTRARQRKGRQAGRRPIQRSKTDFQKVWTYGESTYPPSKRDLRIILPSPTLRKAASANLGHHPLYPPSNWTTRKNNHE